MGKFLSDFNRAVVNIIWPNARSERQRTRTGDFGWPLGMGDEILKFFDDPQALGRLNFTYRLIASLLVVAPWPSLTRHWQGPNALDDVVVTIHIAIQTPRFTVGDDVNPRALLVQDGDVGGIVEQFRQIV